METNRLVLRDLRPDDEAAIVGLWMDPDVARFMDDFGPRTPDQVKEWLPEAIAAKATDPLYRGWAIDLKATGETIGWLGFGADDRGIGDIDFAFIVHPSHRRRGYAAEALGGAVEYCFQVLNVGSFWGQCHTDNFASAGAMRGAGLSFIGTVDGQHRFRVERSQD
jgi:RimJ/RimL family protein N-acetyltransferase